MTKRNPYILLSLLFALTASAQLPPNPPGPTIVGNLLTIFGYTNSPLPYVRFIPGTNYIAVGTNTYYPLPQRALITNGLFSAAVVGPTFYDVDFGPNLARVRILAPADTNTYTFNYCAQLAVNAGFGFQVTNNMFVTNNNFNTNITFATNLTIVNTGTVGVTNTINPTNVAPAAAHVLSGDTTTNFTSKGISSPGTASQSEQYGSGANALGLQSTAVGNAASASSQGTALGYQSSAAGSGSVSIGLSQANGATSMAIGAATAQGANDIAIGTGVNIMAANTNSIGLGLLATPTAANQFMLGPGISANFPSNLTVGGTVSANAIASPSISGNGAGITNSPFAGLQYPTINTNQFVLSGLTNGVQPSVGVAYLNGQPWVWNGTSFIDGTNGIFFVANYQGSGAGYWVATNSGYHDLVTPSVLFAILTNYTPLLFPANGTLSPYGLFADGTASANNITGGGSYLTNALVSNPTLAVPFPFPAQPGLSNTLSWITPEMAPYNAVGDGATWDYPAVQSAINDCANYTANGYPVALFLGHRYNMGSNSLNITPQNQKAGLRIYGNSGPWQGVGNGGSGAINGANFTLVWTNGVKNGGIVTTNSAGGDYTGTVIEGVHFKGPVDGTGTAPVGGTVAINLGTSIGVQCVLRNCQFTYWDTCIKATNCAGLSLYNLAASIISNACIISGAQNFKIIVFNAYPRAHGITFADSSTGVIEGLDFAPQAGPAGFSIVAKNSSHVDVIDGNFDLNGCVYNDNSTVNVISCRQGGSNPQIKWVSTNCGLFAFGPNATVFSDPNNVTVAYYNCSNTNNLVDMEFNTPAQYLLTTNSTLGTTNRYIWPGFR